MGADHQMLTGYRPAGHLRPNRARHTGPGCCWRAQHQLQLERREVAYDHHFGLTSSINAACPSPANALQLSAPMIVFGSGKGATLSRRLPPVAGRGMAALERLPKEADFWTATILTR